RQRSFGTHHRQHDLLVERPFPQLRDVGDVHVFQPRIECRAAIAGRNIHRLQLGRLGQFPCQGVLPAATADHQDLHWSISALWNTFCTSSRSSRTSSSFCILAASSPFNSIVFSGRIVTSATSAFRPAASSAFFTASKSV